MWVEDINPLDGCNSPRIKYFHKNCFPQIKQKCTLSFRWSTTARLTVYISVNPCLVSSAIDCRSLCDRLSFTSRLDKISFSMIFSFTSTLKIGHWLFYRLAGPQSKESSVQLSAVFGCQASSQRRGCHKIFITQETRAPLHLAGYVTTLVWRISVRFSHGTTY